MNVFLPDYHLAIAWQAGRGFGIVSDDDHGYGEGADEIFDELEQALPRVVQLLAYRLATAPPEAGRRARAGGREVKLNLLVLRSSRVEELRWFYSALGARFEREQHGNGPIHHAAILGDDLVLEMLSGRRRCHAGPRVADRPEHQRHR